MKDQALSVTVLRTIEELEKVRPEWESWPGNRDSEMEPYLRFLQSNPGSVRPHVLVVYCGGRPDAIMVGRIDLGHISCRLGYARFNLSARILCFVYGALRGNPSKENCDLIVSSVMQSLSDGEADVAYMNFLKTDSDLCRLSTEKPGLLSRDRLLITQPHFAATLPTSMDEYYRSLPPGSKKFNRSKHNKLLKDFAGRISIKCFSEAAEVDAMVDEVEKIAKTSYQRALGVGFIDSPRMREIMRMMARHGWLRVYLLYLADQPCAYWIGDINRGIFGGNYVGYDTQFAKYSPGMFLSLKVIESFCNGHRDGVTGVDFGPGEAKYKEMLSNQKWQETAGYIFAPSLKGMRLNLTRSLVGEIDLGIKKVLARTNLLQRVKKHWRTLATRKAES